MKTNSIHLRQSLYYIYLIFIIAVNIILAVNYKFHYYFAFYCAYSNGHHICIYI